MACPPSAGEKMDEIIANYAAQCYGITKSQLKPMSGGHCNYVYEFFKDNKNYVLRITPNESDINLTKGMVGWVNYLSSHDVSVSKAVPSANNKLIELIKSRSNYYSIVAFEKADGVLAEALSKDEWNDRLYLSIGKVVGKMHTLSKRYTPSGDLTKRPEWDKITNCYNPIEKLDPSHAMIKEKKEGILNYLNTLPKDMDNYGLIHGDLHLGNFFVDTKNSRITLFDFDDCCYGWYAMDIVLPLLDILVVYNELDNEKFAAHFIKHYLKGYIMENHITTFWIKQLPYFLKLLEIGIYTMLYNKYDSKDINSWPGKFMPNRKHRIENDIPYVDIDFEGTFAL